MSYIPEKLWEVIRIFLLAKKSGQIVLHIHDGNVLKVDLNESVRA